ncbi:hypothetical protein HNP03_003953 [Pseudomonas rhodesiae]|nr:hypothetical protein [Pseudomonas rhodesiae]
MLNLARGVAGALGQGADFGGYHGKAAALVAGTGRFDGSVECQQVGLFGNRADGAEGIVGVLRVLAIPGHLKITESPRMNVNKACVGSLKAQQSVLFVQQKVEWRLRKLKAPYD